MKRTLPDLSILLLLALIHFSSVSLPPADQDVGGITYNAMLINEGHVPYRGSFEQKLPGAFFIVAGVITLFGPTVYGLNTGAFMWNALHLLVLIWGVRRHAGRPWHSCWPWLLMSSTVPVRTMNCGWTPF
jgi:hypothetical protein